MDDVHSRLREAFSKRIEHLMSNLDELARIERDVQCGSARFREGLRLAEVKAYQDEIRSGRCYKG